MKYAPIALFAYNRPVHLRQTVEALAANQYAAESDLYVFSDGPRNDTAAAAVTEVREVMAQITGFKSVTLVRRENNLGLAGSIVGGVTELVNMHDRVIVLEDDMVTCPYFLRYMNEALELYADAEEVISIHGYIYPVSTTLPETFFLRGADCWSWATWRRGWAHFEPDGKKLMAELERRGLCREFDFDGSAGYTRMLQRQIEGTNDSWAVRWYAAAFLLGKLTLYPGRSMMQNIGNDGSGRHGSTSARFQVEVAARPISLHKLACVEDADARRAVQAYFQRGQHTSLWRWLKSKLRWLAFRK